MIEIKSRKAQLALGCAFSVLLALYFVFFFRTPIAKVGDWKIYQADSEYRDRIILLDFPNEKRSMGLYQLMKSAMNLAILKNNGVVIQKPQIEREEERINKSTKNPEQLAKIKAIFGKDTEAYRRDFVLPALVDHMIYYDFFLTDEKVQAESLKPVLSFIQEAAAHPERFSDLAATKNLEVHQLIVSLKKGLIWIQKKKPLDRHQGEPVQSSLENQEIFARIQADLKKRSEESINEEAQKWIDQIIRPLKVGDVASAPISREESWLALKLAKKISNDTYELLVISFPKVNFNQWYEAEKAKVEVEVANKQLKTF